MPPKYAAKTTVPVSSSRGEITGILAKHGVAEMGWMTQPRGDQLLFKLNGLQYRFFIEKPTIAEMKSQDPNAYANVDWDKRVEQEWMRRWRAHVLLLKAKLEFAAADESTIERELLPYVLLADGRTLEEVVIDGGLPTLTGGQLMLASGE